MNLRQLMGKISDLLKLMCRIKGIQYSIKVSDDIPTDIGTESARLKQILMQLTNNALKYTFKGHIKIFVEPLLLKEQPHLNLI